MPHIQGEGTFGLDVATFMSWSWAFSLFSRWVLQLICFSRIFACQLHFSASNCGSLTRLCPQPDWISLWWTCSGYGSALTARPMSQLSSKQSTHELARHTSKTHAGLATACYAGQRRAIGFAETGSCMFSWMLLGLTRFLDQLYFAHWACSTSMTPLHWYLKFAFLGCSDTLRLEWWWPDSHITGVEVHSTPQEHLVKLLCWSLTLNGMYLICCSGPRLWRLGGF